MYKFIKFNGSARAANAFYAVANCTANLYVTVVYSDTRVLSQLYTLK